jgi:predicted helicase
MDLALFGERPLVIFTTYDSYPVVEKIKNSVIGENYHIDLLLLDEAHYSTMPRYHRNIFKNQKAKKQYYFTATPVHFPSKEGRGMNNEKIYGNLINTIPPKELVNRGISTVPVLSMIKSRYGNIHDETDLELSSPNIIYETFQCLSQEKFLSGPPKMLVSTNGSDSMLKFLKSDYHKKLLEFGVEIFAISSNKAVGIRRNGEFLSSRDEFLKLLKGDELSNKPWIVLHYDILSEGFDIDKFNGCLLLRSMPKHKLVQTIGRVTRCDKEDMENIKKGLVNLKNIKDREEKLKKPYSFIYIPFITKTNLDSYELYMSCIRDMRGEEYDPNEHLTYVIDMAKGVPKKTEWEEFILRQSYYYRKPKNEIKDVRFLNEDPTLVLLNHYLQK